MTGQFWFFYGSTQEVTGTAATAIAAPTLNALGVETFSGGGAVAIEAPALTAIGGEAFSSSGALAVAAPTLAAVGVETFGGNGAIAIAAPTLHAVGIAARRQPVAIGDARRRTAPRRVVAPPPQRRIEAVGTLRIAAPRLAGAGVVAFVGMGTSRFVFGRLSGEGGLQMIGTGSVSVVARATGAGAVRRRQVVSMRASHPVRSLQGAGSMAVAGMVLAATGAVTGGPPIDATDDAWQTLQRTAQQQEDDDLLLLGVFDI